MRRVSQLGHSWRSGFRSRQHERVLHSGNRFRPFGGYGFPGPVPLWRAIEPASTILPRICEHNLAESFGQFAVQQSDDGERAGMRVGHALGACHVCLSKWRGFHDQHPRRVVSDDVADCFSEGCFLLFGEFRFFHSGLPC